MAEVTRIEDGFALTVSCKDGALIELQVNDEERPQRLWELFIQKGTSGIALDGLTQYDLRRLADGVIQLADAIERSGA